MVERVYKMGYRIVGFIPAIIVVYYLMHQVVKRVRIYTNEIEVVRYLSHRVIDIAVARDKNILWHPFKSKDAITQITDSEVNKWLY
jgi:hypothetical protein